jgi:UTP:GlnB (protein PII) uridylyltransferase
VTLGDQVEDVFFITTVDHKALSSNRKLQIKEALVDAFTEKELLQ